jgi:acetyltransferase-like isoleucine patch superfamily enzyme
MWNDPLSHWIAWLARTAALKWRHRGRGLRVGWMASARGCTFGRHNTLYDHVVLDNVVLGDLSYVSRGTRMANATVGRFSCIGPEVLVGLGRHPTRGFVSSHPSFYSLRGQAQQVFVSAQKFDEFLPVHIGNDVWIGARAIVLDGARIGDGAIVAAGSVVSGEVPPYAIVSGVPAKVVRHRFDDATIEAIRRSAWWDLDLDVLRAHADAFADPAAFVAWQAGARAAPATNA